MKDTTTILFNEEVCTLSSKRTLEPYGTRQKHTILYISNPFVPEDLKHSGITKRPEYTIKGDFPDIDKAWKQYNRAELQIQKRIINQAVRDGLLEDALAKELKWSRKAGCFCGCSPGWKARDFRRQSVWLTVTSPSKEQEKKEKKQESLSKKEAETLSSMVI